MPRRSEVVSQLLRYGVRYAPLAYEGLKRTREPVAQLAERRLTRRTARAIALEHAAHLVDGSVLPVYDGDLRVWVVFSGDQVVGTHPVVATPTETLLAHYDLGKRVRPGASARARLELPRPDMSGRDLPRPRPRRGRAGARVDEPS